MLHCLIVAFWLCSLPWLSLVIWNLRSIDCKSCTSTCFVHLVINLMLLNQEDFLATDTQHWTMD